MRRPELPCNLRQLAAADASARAAGQQNAFSTYKDEHERTSLLACPRARLRASELRAPCDDAAALTAHTGRTYTRTRHLTALIHVACGTYALIQCASVGGLLQPAVARQQRSATAGLLCTALRNDKLQSSTA